MVNDKSHSVGEVEKEKERFDWMGGISAECEKSQVKSFVRGVGGVSSLVRKKAKFCSRRS